MFFVSLAVALLVAICSIIYLRKYNFNKKISHQPTLFDREWERISTSITGNNFSFVMMTFNMLADGLSGIGNENPEKSFCGVPARVLEWKYRFGLILKEIERVNPDVLCLQECDHIQSMSESLKGLGYDFQFQCKDFSPVLNLNVNASPDGVGIFYKRDKFQLVDVFKTKQARHRRYIQDTLTNNPQLSSSIDISELKTALLSETTQFRADLTMAMMSDEIGIDLKTTPKIERTVLDDWLKQPLMFPVAVAVKLRPRTVIGSGVGVRDVVIVTTHLTSKKIVEAEKLRVQEVHDLLTSGKFQEFVQDASVFIGGDLNSASKDTKGYPPLVYRYLVGSKAEEEMKQVDELEKPFTSAMRTCLGNEPAYTTWKHRAKNGVMKEDKHTIDYLLFDSNRWAVSKYFGIPSEDDVQKERVRARAEWNLDLLPSALPSAKYPSDHFAIAVEFVVQG